MGEGNAWFKELKDRGVSVGFQFDENGSEFLVWLRGLFKKKALEMAIRAALDKNQKVRRWIIAQVAARKIAQKIKEVENMESKKWYTSRTLIFNVLSAIATVATTIASPEVAADPRVQSTALLVVTIVNTILRLITNQPIGKGESK